MKLFSRKTGNKIVNINGQNVKFVNGIAEVSDEFGAEVLKLGLPEMYEFGKQPAFVTPKEVQIKADFKDKEDWYKKELGRLTNIKEAREADIKKLKNDVEMWKAEYQKEHDLRVALSSTGVVQPQPEPVASTAVDEEAADPTESYVNQDGPIDESNTDEEAALRADLGKMKKDELIKFGEESGFEMEPIKDKTKAEIIDFLVNPTKE